ncbi:hypothetical protein CONLIGDRAFT_629615 [Coniochaeta ligniaria NRRL 30616]|uniref:Uncharacterized protein n=1 Tax=Coniochaeta ligniaria NRRL 30616 TaxID=1408157 RepID=A0A1J7JVY8_9PEZI|nr:hypothetical protein CONLIGDRAFT_629615 [Coniochaeta ligniaria NRRL 30616]
MHLHGLLLSIILALCTSPSSVLAADCRRGCGSGRSCGSITNNSGRSLVYTENPNPNLDAHAGRCRFWNWYSDDSAIHIIPHDQTVSCTQTPLASGSGKKGGCAQKIDVDGFSFANNRYWILVPGSSVPVPVGAGVWTKFPNVVDVTCRRVPVVGSIVCTLV